MKKRTSEISMPRSLSSPRNPAFLSICALFISAVLFFIVLGASISAMGKFLLCAGVLVACGLLVTKWNKFEGGLGLYLLRSNWGLNYIDSLAKKHPVLWQKFAELGMIVGYGSLAYFLVGRKKLNWSRELPLYAAGGFLLVLFSGLIPVGMSLLLSMVSGGAEFSSASAKLSAQVSSIGIYQYVSIGAMVIGGIALMATMSVVTYALLVGSAVVSALLGNGAHLAATAPGGMPILPGINLDLVQGVLALAIVLVVHEGMHGILARKHKLPLTSAGLVFFGFLPFGAFVDVDDKKLFKSEKVKQNSVMIAGVTANFATALVVFALLLVFVFAFPGPQFPAWAKWTARFLALTFALNMAVAAVNLIPLPFFDGYHLMCNIVNSKKAATIIMYIVAAAFLLTLFPWVLR